jgi:SAM-dependent methyltransferase
MSAAEDLDRYLGSYAESFPYHDENLAMLSFYAQRMIAGLRRQGARSLVSLGVGHRVVSRALLAELVPALDSYRIVEGSRSALDGLRAESLPANVELVHAYFEDYLPPEPVDAVEMGFVLEHVDDPAYVLRRWAGALRPGGVIVVVVPNARALHRRFGQAAGLLDDLYRLSPADLELGHKRYFDLERITRLVAETGLRVDSVEGVLLKCLTTAQLASLALPDSVRRAFLDVGREFPDIANAIYLEARP